MRTECSPDGNKSPSEGQGGCSLVVQARGLSQSLVQVLRCQMLFFLFLKIIFWGSKSREVQAGGKKNILKAKSASTDARAVPLLPLLPSQSSMNNCWGGGQGMTGARPFQARVSGNLASKGIHQLSTLSKDTCVEKNLRASDHVRGHPYTLGLSPTELQIGCQN